MDQQATQAALVKMPPLEIGIYKALNRIKLRNNGFTLLEILIVTLIIAIVVSFATMLFGDFLKKRKVENAAKEFAMLLPLASQQAILQPTTIGLKINSKRYQFYFYVTNVKKHTGSWKLLIRDPILKPRTLPRNVEINLNDINQQDQPQIIFLPSGDNSPFTITFSNQGKAPFYSVKGNSQGEFKIEQVKK